jgi:hypothetical protein
MALEDRHQDILENIEANIARVDREYGPLRDVDAIKALEALTSYWQRIALGKEPPSRELPEASEKIFDAVRNSLELNKTRKEQRCPLSSPAFQPGFTGTHPG